MTDEKCAGDDFTKLSDWLLANGWTRKGIVWFRPGFGDQPAARLSLEVEAATKPHNGAETL